MEATTFTGSHLHTPLPNDGGSDTSSWLRWFTTPSDISFPDFLHGETSGLMLHRARGAATRHVIALALRGTPFNILHVWSFEREWGGGECIILNLVELMSRSLRREI